MFREMIKLAWQAAKVELAHWKNPTPTGAPIAADAPVAKAESSPTTTPFLDRMRAGERCPFCAKTKTVGELMCTPCDDFRKPLRAKAAAAKAGAA